MAVSRVNPISITDIEQQIATVTIELEKARAQHFASAEANYLAAQKAVSSAQTKVNELSAKATTSAARNRLVLARTALEEQEAKLTDTKTIFDDLKLAQEAAQDFNEKVELLLAGKKIGKKIKFTKKEKAVLKKDKKAAKKIAKAERKLAKDEKAKTKKHAKSENRIAILDVAEDEKFNKDHYIDNAVTSIPAQQEKPVAPKKSPAKKIAVKKAAPVATLADTAAVETALSNNPEPSPAPIIEEPIELAVTAVPEATSVESVDGINVNPDIKNSGIETLDPNAEH